MRRASIAGFLACAAAAALFAACSSNAGFGGAPPYQGGGPQPNGTPPNGSVASPFGDETAEPTDTPNTPLSVDSANARLAYDGYPADPVKAPRLVEVTFALSNPQQTPQPVSDVGIAADTAKAQHVGLSLEALADQDTVETLVAVAPPKDYSKTKQLNLTFTDKGTLLAQDTIDFPTTSDATMTPLDKKTPAGGLTIDDVAVSQIAAPGSGLHYDVTFSATNAGTSDASIAYFTIAPPKSDPVKIAIPLKIPARTGMSPISIVMPYSGKSKTLPTGTYTVTASDGKNALAQGTGPLL